MVDRLTWRRIAVFAVTAVTLVALAVIPSLPARAESIGLHADYWKVGTQVSFPDGTEAQKIAGGAIQAGAVVPLFPGLTGEIQYSLGKGLTGQQGSQQFSVAASKVLVGLSYALLRHEQLEFGPMAGYLRESNQFTWGSGEAAPKYNVDSSGFVVGARAVVAPLPAVIVEGRLLYGPKVKVADSSGHAPASYDSTYLDMQGRVAYEIWSNVQVEAGYQRVIQTATAANAPLWKQNSAGLFAGIRVAF